jgi:hypothetical protein
MPSQRCVTNDFLCPKLNTTDAGQILKRNLGCPIVDQCQIGINGVGFIVIAEYLDLFFDNSTQDAAYTDTGNHEFQVSPERPCVMTFVNSQHRQFNMTLLGRSLAAYMLKIRYPAWQSYTELPRQEIVLPSPLPTSDPALGDELKMMSIKDIPISIGDDLIYLYIGSTSSNLGHNATVKLTWVKNLPPPMQMNT